MPKKSTVRKARADKRQGKSASTQAGEFVREEIESIRRGEHGARSTKQAIAIGLSKARRAGVKLKPPKSGQSSKETIEHAERDIERGKHPKKPNRKRSRAALKALKREGTAAASHEALSRQAKAQAEKRTPSERSAIAKKAARTRKRRA
jgi:hypothetical protein